MQFNQVKDMLGLAILLVLPPALCAQPNPPREPIARAGEVEIYEDDLIPSIGTQLWQLKNQEYELKLKTLMSVLKERLLENEAKKKGLSTEAFLEQNVDRRVPPPSAIEIETFYLAQKDTWNRPLEEVKSQVEAALTRAKRQQARQDYMDQLQRHSSASILLSRPRVGVSPDPSRVRGNAKAPVTIVEFGDFQCSYCGGAQQVLKALMDKYRDKIRIAFRDFPLRQIHPQAQQAAEASRCAGEQEKFWEYHDLLYANQSNLDPNSLREYARTAGLDAERFGACLTSGKFTAAVESDFQAGLTSGVSSTPTFYINGVVMTGLQAASGFEKIIESEIADAASKTPVP